MPRTDKDEEYRQRPDGSMELVSSVPREVSDLQLAIADAQTVLLALLKKDAWQPQDLTDAIVNLSYIVLQQQLLRPPSETDAGQPTPP